VVHAAIRREGLPAVNASDMTAGELVAALQMAREVEEARRGIPGETAPIEEKPAEQSVAESTAASADENVTSLSSARQTK
jgi:hypothetical protein